MKQRVLFPVLVILGVALLCACPWSSNRYSIICSPAAAPLERLAAQEIRRYLYQRTGELLPITLADTPADFDGSVIVVAAKGSPLLDRLDDPASQDLIGRLGEQEYLVRHLDSPADAPLWVVGGDPLGTLYGAYRLAESFGVRFYLHGDVIPDGKIELTLPVLDLREKPLFPLRGILPFHDFPEGPDWWNEDDYKAILAQLAKLRMNFIGLHTYPEGAPNAEPTVWIGPAEETRTDGSVTAAYPASYQNTLRGNWGYAARPTGAFAYGASQLFESDAFGADVMRERMPEPVGEVEQNQLFNETGRMLNAAFSFGRSLGIRTCVGTETPLKVPEAVRARLRRFGRDSDRPEVRESLYEGLFRRIASAYPIDYYWLWTNENWTWSPVSDRDVAEVEADLRRAVSALERVGSPFRLATCGWVLGPPKDRAQFDRLLPQDIPFSCINRQLGKDPVDAAFRRLQGRPKWAIPWMEDDPRLISPQLWVGRMRKDAYDARRYGCTGLMGIHWRTRVVGPTIAALAQAAWDQGGWSDGLSLSSGSGDPITLSGGTPTRFADSEPNGGPVPPLIASQREGNPVYQFQVPNGTYRVTLHFAEMEYQAINRRVFHARIQGDRVVESLDIFARVGASRELRLSFPGIAVNDGVLAVDFVPVVGVPAIAAIEVAGKGVRRQVNCGGPEVGEFQADPESAPDIPRQAPSGDFYLDWAQSQFGEEVSAEAAALFASIDGRLHEPSQWLDGPGGINPNSTPWEEVAADYTFVDGFQRLETQVSGPGCRERYAYWLNTFLFMKETARIGCSLGEMDQQVRRLRELPAPNERREQAEAGLLPLRRRLAEEWGRMMGYLLATVETTGELGTVANLEQHSFQKLGLLTRYDTLLEQTLSRELPADCFPWTDYRGPLRLIVPTRRGLLEPGEDLVLRLIVLSAVETPAPILHWRRLGDGSFATIRASHRARGVYEVRLSAPGGDLEYYVTAGEGRDQVRVPAAAPAVNQVVVVARTVL